MPNVLRRLASLATSLSHAELRVLLALAVRAEAAEATEVMASSRHLAQTTNLARASVQAAIDSLNARRLLQSDPGTPTRPAVHRLVCFHAEVNVGGPIAEPPVAESLSHPGLAPEPQVAFPLSQGGLATGPGVAQPMSHRRLMVEPDVAQAAGHPGLPGEPLPDEKSTACTERIQKRASVRADSIDFDFDKTIDRLQKAKKDDFEDSIFELARMKMAGHHAKYAREENRLPGLPDDAITAQFLAVAEWPRLETLLYDLAAERKEAGYSYAWYVTVALQRIHGLSPARVREMRARLKSSTKANSNIAAASRPTPLRDSEAFGRKPSGRERSTGFERGADTAQLKQQIRAIAAARSMR